MSEKPNQDWLEQILRREQPYINDQGFTTRVVAALPAKHKSTVWKPVLLTTMALIGGVIAIVAMNGDQYLSQSFARLLAARSLSAIPLAPVVVIALVFWYALAGVASEN